MLKAFGIILINNIFKMLGKIGKRNVLREHYLKFIQIFFINFIISKTADEKFRQKKLDMENFTCYNVYKSADKQTLI